MKAFIILGAIVGFAIGAGFGLAGSSPWPATFWRACAAALLAAVLTRWWSKVWIRSLRESFEHRAAPRTPVDIPAKPAAKA